MSDRTSANKTMIIDFTIYNFLENGEIFFNLIQDYRKRGVSLTNFLYQLFVEYDELINSNVIKLLDCNQMVEYFVENFNIHCESDFYNLLRNQDLFMIDLDIPYKRTCTMNMTNMQHQMVYERLKDFSQEEAAMEIYKSLRQHVVMKKDPYYMKIQTEILFNDLKDSYLYNRKAEINAGTMASVIKYIKDERLSAYSFPENAVFKDSNIKELNRLFGV